MDDLLQSQEAREILQREYGADGKLLRQDIADAMHAVIGSMMIDPDCIPGVLLELSADDFILSSLHKKIFAATADLYRAGHAVDALLVAKAANLDQAERDLLAAWMEVTPTSANVLEYAKILKLNNLFYLIRAIGHDMEQSTTLESALKWLDMANQYRAGQSRTKALNFLELFDRFANRHDEEHQAVKVLKWPLEPLNEKLRVEPGNIIVLGAYPGDGKTAFALQCAAKFAENIDQNKKIGYFLFESTPDLLFDRFISRETGIAGSRIRQNALSDEEWDAIAASAAQKRLNPPIEIIPASGMSAQDITAFALAKRYEIIFIDYLQNIAAPSGVRLSEYDRVTEASHVLQCFAARTNTTVFELSQFNRSEKNRTRTPTMSDLRSSGQIEQDADVILLMWRETYDFIDSPRIIQIAKNRHGESMGKIKCHFDGEHQEFTRMASGWQSQSAPQSKPKNAQKSMFDPADDDGDMPF